VCPSVNQDLFALVLRKQLTAVVGGPQHGTQYSMEKACPKCGTGADQLGPLRLPRFRPPASETFLTLDNEVLVGLRLGDRLREAGVMCLGDVLDAKSGASLDVLQLRPQVTLPPFGPETRGVVRERPCPVCGRDGYYGVPHEPYRLCYATLDESLASKDVLATHERFGTSVLRQPFSESVFAAPVLVVGSRVAAVLKAERLRYVELQPVQVAAR
jgi:hypothetical protein